MQQPHIEQRSTHHVKVGAGGMRAKRQCASVVAGLHVSANQGDFSVGGMHDQRSTFECIERASHVEPGQRDFAFPKQLGTFLQTGWRCCCFLANRMVTGMTIRRLRAPLFDNLMWMGVAVSLRRPCAACRSRPQAKSQQ